MKLSKSLLAAMVVGVGIGASVSSCAKLNLEKEFGEDNPLEQVDGTCVDPGTDHDPGSPTMPDNCPACGLG